MSDRVDEKSGGQGAASGIAQPLQLARILFVDGEGVDRFRLASDLKQAGAIVDFASTGDEATESIAHATKDAEPYDAVLLDLSTFDTGGFDVAEQLRRAQYAGPILALTDGSLKKIAAQGIEAGCDDLLQKPVATCVLLDALSTMVTRERSRRYVTARPDEVTSELAAYPELMMMLRRFVSTLPDTVEEVLAAQRERDIQKLRDWLDQIKRNATSHGYIAIRASAVTAQHELDEARKPDADTVTEAIDDLVDLCRRATASPSKPPPTSGPPLPPSG